MVVRVRGYALPDGGYAMPRGGHALPRGRNQVSSAASRNHLHANDSADGCVSSRQQGDERLCGAVLVVLKDFAEESAVWVDDAGRSAMAALFFHW